MYELETLLVAGLTGTATIILAAFAIIQSYSAKTQADSAKTQTDIMSKEFDISHRPWLGITTDAFEHTSANNLVFHYKNYGSTLAINVKERGNISQNLPTRESIITDMSNLYPNSINLPTQERFFTMTVDETLLAEGLVGKHPLYVWAILDFVYGDGKTGQYGIIVKLTSSDKTTIIDEWAM